jgi:hypothetical protein
VTICGAVAAALYWWSWFVNIPVPRKREDPYRWMTALLESWTIWVAIGVAAGGLVALIGAVASD